MPGNGRLVPVKQISHLIQRQPYRFIFDFYVNVRKSIFRLVDDNLTLVIFHNIGKGTPSRCEALGGEELPSLLYSGVTIQDPRSQKHYQQALA